MLDVIGAAPGSQNTIDWPQIWRESPEKAKIKMQLAEMKEELSSKPVNETPDSLKQFAAPANDQFYIVTKRVFEQYWRTPSYLYSKTLLCTGSVSDLPNAPKSTYPNITPGALHRLFLLEFAYQPSRPTESTLLHLHAHDHFRQHRSADHAPLCRPKSPVRSSRTSIKDLLLESLCHVQCRRRVALEYSHGCHHLLLLVLPHRHVQERHTRWTSARARRPYVLVDLGLPDVHFHIHAYGRCWN
jgi:hypothetical protein